MAKKKKKTVVKAKKKKWFQIIAPKQFMEQVIAECPTFEQQQLIGKKLTLNMMTLTKDPRTQGISITFRVNGLRADKGTTEITGYRMLPTTIKRMVRRGKDRLDATLKLTTKDGAKVVVKPVILTRNRTTSSVHKSLAGSLKASLARNIKKVTYKDLVGSIIRNKIQREVFSELKKIYPLAVFKIRSMTLQSEIKPEEEVTETEEKVEKKTETKKEE